MFTRTDAEKLRASLAPLNFEAAHTGTDSVQSDSDLLAAYRDYYGLNLDSSELPIKHNTGTIESENYTLVAHYFTLPLERQSGTAFLLHGYFDHSGLYGHLIKHCLEQGYAVVIFDLPGHGLSSGEVASIDSFRRYNTALLRVLEEADKGKLHQPWAMLGQSTGCAVIMDSIQDNGLLEKFAINSLVLLAPLLRPARWWSSRLSFLLLGSFLHSTPRTFAVNSHNEVFLDFLKNHDALQSKRLPMDWVRAMMEYQRRFHRAAVSPAALNIIQGSGDGTVDWKYNLPKIQQHFPNSITHVIAGARHHLVNESLEYREQTYSLIDGVLKRSG